MPGIQSVLYKILSKVFKIQLKVLSCKSILNTVENTVLQKYFKYEILNTFAQSIENTKYFDANQ